MKELVNAIVAEYEVFAKNAEAQVEKGNKAAGARARKASLAIEKMMKEFRKVSIEASIYQEMRSFYRLEQLWGDAEDVDITQFLEKEE